MLSKDNTYQFIQRKEYHMFHKITEKNKDSIEKEETLFSLLLFVIAYLIPCYFK